MEDDIFSADDIELSRHIAEEHKLCVRCLGRLFASRGHGISNSRRGELLHLHGAMVHDPEECEICLGAFDFVDDFASAVIASLEGYEFSTFKIGSHFIPVQIEREKSLWQKYGLDGESIKSEMNREVGKKVLNRLHDMGMKVTYAVDADIVAIVDTAFVDVELQIKPLYIFGRYRKLQRGIPQTRWPCRVCGGLGCERCNYTGKMYPESVEELIGQPILEITGGSGHAFHGMGREDIDALMLGNGRPFVIEITDPRKRTLDLEEVQGIINSRAEGKVEVNLMGFVSARTVRFIKSAKPSKEYIIRVKVDASENEIKDALKGLVGEIRQRTPERVSHRRADLVRKRHVYSIAMVGKKDDVYEIRVHGESGLYIKELMHGDKGRTVPSLASLLNKDVEVVSLDVIAVHDDDLQYPEGDWIKNKY